MKISRITVRFNCELKPFQHGRVEVSVNKGDDLDEVRREATEYAASVMDEIEEKVYVAREVRRGGPAARKTKRQVDPEDAPPGGEMPSMDDKPF